MSEQALSRVILGGILFKKGALFGSWKPRYYYIEYSAGVFKLCYKNNEDDPRSRGSLALTSFDVMLSESEDDGKCGFILETSDRVVLLRAATPKDRAKWVGQLTLIKEAVAPPSHALAAVTAVACTNCTATLLLTQSVRCELCGRPQCATPPCTVHDRIGRSLCGECAATQPEQPRDSENPFDTRTGIEGERLLVTVVEAFVGDRPVDSYVIVKIGESSKQSPVVLKSTNPHWALQADLSLSSQAPILQVMVYRHDMLGFHQSLGITTVPVAHLEDRRVYDDWFALVGGNPGARVRLLLVRAGAGASDARGLAIARLVRVISTLQVARVWEALATTLSFQDPVVTVWAWIGWCVTCVTLPTELIPTLILTFFALLVAANIISDAIEGGEAFKHEKLQQAATHTSARRAAWVNSAKDVVSRSVDGEGDLDEGDKKRKTMGNLLVLRDERGRLINDRSRAFEDKVYYDQMRRQGSYVTVPHGMEADIDRDNDEEVMSLIAEAQMIHNDIWSPSIPEYPDENNSGYMEMMRSEKAQRGRNSYSYSSKNDYKSGTEQQQNQMNDGNSGRMRNLEEDNVKSSPQAPRDWIEAFGDWVSRRYNAQSIKEASPSIQTGGERGSLSGKGILSANNLTEKNTGVNVTPLNTSTTLNSREVGINANDNEQPNNTVTDPTTPNDAFLSTERGSQGVYSLASTMKQAMLHTLARSRMANVLEDIIGYRRYAGGNEDPGNPESGMMSGNGNTETMGLRPESTTLSYGVADVGDALYGDTELPQPTTAPGVNADGEGTIFGLNATGNVDSAQLVRDESGVSGNAMYSYIERAPVSNEHTLQSAPKSPVQVKTAASQPSKDPAQIPETEGKAAKSSSEPPVVKFSLQKHANLVGGTATSVVNTGSSKGGAADAHVTAGVVQTLPYPKRRQQTRNVLATALLLEIVANVLCLNPDVTGEARREQQWNTLKFACLAILLSLVIPTRVLLVAVGTGWMLRQMRRYQEKEIVADGVKAAVEGRIYNS